MKRLFFNSRTLCLLLLALAGLSFTGCKTSNVDRENVSERPWNSPTSWEQAGPMSSVIEQH